MNINLTEILVKDLFNGYQNNDDEGVVAYGGKLDVRPKYQREFIYSPHQQIAVINSILNDYPLNVMYWASKSDGTFEIMDGQQRTLSICSFIDGDFSILRSGSPMWFNNLSEDDKKKILNYKLMVYICDGTDTEKLEWFKIINIAGEELTPQELRNAVYAGSWATDAKRHFSKINCAGYKLSQDYVSANYRRQELLETAIKWICEREKCSIEEYMAQHQFDDDSNELWLYFKAVIDWIETTFPKKRVKEMKGVNWGYLYNKYKDNTPSSNSLETKIQELMKDSDITKRSGIYGYVLGEPEKVLSIRTFDDNMKRAAYERQGGHCANGSHCLNDSSIVWDISEMEADHITPWSQGGKTIAENCQMLCKDCNRHKSDR